MSSKTDAPSNGPKASAARNRKRFYSGALNEPIRIPPGMLFQPGSSERRRYISERIRAALLLLSEHYGIAPNAPRWQELALNLALDHVPAMQLADSQPSKKGRPRQSISSARELVQSIEGIAGDRDKGLADAIRIAKGRGIVKGSVKALENRYRSSKKQVADADELARVLNATWSAFVRNTATR
jgi:hypothetical protein